MNQFLEIVSGFLALYCITPLVLLVGLYLTCRLRFIQITKLKLGVSALMCNEEGSQGNISHFQAISTVLAGNLGTGNISGIAVALLSGGPGSLVWMWLMAFLGAILKFAGCLLGVKYRHQNEEGEYVGGPMYYLDHGLGYKRVAKLFAFFAIITAFTVGNIVQVNSISLPLETIGWDPLWAGVVVAVIVGFVLLGGTHRFALIASAIVPLMALLFFGVALAILVMHSDRVPSALSLMFRSAFGFDAAFGGAIGYTIFKAMGAGFERGIFATDAGVGIAPVLQASARTKSAVIEGAVAMVAPIVVMCISTITGLVLIVTGAWEVEGLKSTNMCTWAFVNGLGHISGMYIVILCLLLFAFTTILAWAYCAERAIEYLWGLEFVRLFKYLYVLAIPIGALAHVDLVWHLADISLAGMLFTNSVALVGLSGVVIAESRQFFSWK